MSFGEPNLSNDPVRCLNCGEEYPEAEANLRHAGRTENGDYWNILCPECGAADTMQEKYAEMSEEEFQEKQREFNSKK